MLKASLTLAAGLLLSTTVLGQPYSHPYGGYAAPYYGGQGYRPGLHTAPPPSQQAEFGPEMIVREGLGRLRAFVANGGAGDAERVRAFAETQIAPYFDFPYMAQWVGGKYWGRMSEAQKRETADALRDRFLGSLARNLSGYHNPDLVVHRARQTDEDEINVPVTVRYGQGSKLRLTFRFYRSPTGWKVFDANANGVSALVHYRKRFARQTRQAQADGTMRQPPTRRAPYGGYPYLGGYSGGYPGGYPQGYGYR